MSIQLPTVSVVITNHNYAQYLPKAIDSVLAQSYAVREVIVVDDGSIDRSAEVIKSYEGRVAAIFLPNRGQAAAINRGFGLVTGDVVVFLDADDYLAPEHLSRVAETFASRTDVTMVQSRVCVVGPDGERLSETIHHDTPSGDLRAEILRGELCSWAPTSAHAYATRFLRIVMPIPEEDRICADYYICNTVPILGRVVTLPEASVFYRLHGRNGFAGAFGEKELDLERLKQFVARHERLIEGQRRLVHAFAEPSALAELNHGRNVGFLRANLCLWRFDQSRRFVEKHPLTLCREGIRASFLDRRFNLVAKIASAAWFVLVLAGPRRLAQWAATQFYCKAGRNPFTARFMGSALSGRQQPSA